MDNLWTVYVEGPTQEGLRACVYYVSAQHASDASDIARELWAATHEGHQPAAVEAHELGRPVVLNDELGRPVVPIAWQNVHGQRFMHYVDATPQVVGREITPHHLDSAPGG